MQRIVLLMACVLALGGCQSKTEEASAEPASKGSAGAKDDECRTKPDCKKEGLCNKGKAGNCVATSDADCAASDACKENGRCSKRDAAEEVMCQTTSDADCAKSERCAKYEQCKAYKLDTTIACDTSAAKADKMSCTCEK